MPPDSRLPDRNAAPIPQFFEFGPRSARLSGQHERVVCDAVRQMTAEFFFAAHGRVGPRRERRRFVCHIRQIAMYVCHVALRMTQTTIGLGFGLDRSTVAHACAVVEDRRDDREFDEFVAAVERIAVLAFGEIKGLAHD